jgi:hypothetical protein
MYIFSSECLFSLKFNRYASTSQGGNPETGTGGKAGKIGFNRGNGTYWYSHAPFSENAQLMQRMHTYSNVDRPGRFIFRVDEWIQPAGCSNTEFGEELMDESKFSAANDFVGM